MNSNAQQDAPAPTSWFRRWCVSIFGVVEKLTLAALVASSVSSLLYFDFFGVGMFFTYAPRIIWLCVAIIFLVAYLVRRQYGRAKRRSARSRT